MATVAQNKKINLIDRAVGMQVRKLRNGAGLEIETCAALIGASVHELQEQENGIRRISTVHLMALAKLFSVPIGTLFASVDGK